MCIFMQKNSVLAVVELMVLAFAVVFLFAGNAQGAALPGVDDNKYDRDYQNPGVHELATWLIAQLRQTNNQASVTNAVGGCRYQSAAKRNSEIINSLLRLPQIDNGKK